MNLIFLFYLVENLFNTFQTNVVASFAAFTPPSLDLKWGLESLLSCQWMIYFISSPNTPSSKMYDDCSGLPLVDTVEHLQLILRLLCAFRSVAPASMRDHVLDFAGLLEGTRTACSGCDQTERLAELQVDLLELLSGSDAHQIAWMKEVGGAI